MPHPPGTLEALAEVIADRVSRASTTTRLTLVRAAADQPAKLASPPQLLLRRISFLSTTYGLGWLVDQEVLALGPLATWPPRSLAALIAKLERARECILDGISLEDAGLVQAVHPSLATDE